MICIPAWRENSPLSDPLCSFPPRMVVGEKSTFEISDICQHGWFYFLEDQDLRNPADHSCAGTLPAKGFGRS